jgi:hypothetical protein
MSEKTLLSIVDADVLQEVQEVEDANVNAALGKGAEQRTTSRIVEAYLPDLTHIQVAKNSELHSQVLPLCHNIRCYLL